MPDSLCQLVQDWHGDLPPEGTFFEEKYEGWRCLWFRGVDGKARLWSKNGMPLEGLDHIAYRLSLFEQAAGQPLFLDGELQVDGSLALTKHWLETGWRKGGAKGTLYLFDALPDPDWRTGKSDQPLIERKAWLTDLGRKVDLDPDYAWDWRPGSRGGDDPTCVQVLPDSWAWNTSDVLDAAKRAWASGKEGLVLKDAEAPYRRGRSRAWRRVTVASMAKPSCRIRR